MIYVFDIDGTVCSNTNGNYEHAEPFLDRIDKVNKLYDAGHKIIYMTARGMGRSNNNRDFAYNEFYNFTHAQLTEWGAKFHELYLGKPEADIFVDDKGQWSEIFFSDNKKISEDLFDEL
jgi:histidinol phosphatase-like enzyme